MLCDHCEIREATTFVLKAGAVRLVPPEGRCLSCYRELWEQVVPGGGSITSIPIPAGLEAQWQEEAARLGQPSPSAA